MKIMKLKKIEIKLYDDDTIQQELDLREIDVDSIISVETIEKGIGLFPGIIRIWYKS